MTHQFKYLGTQKDWQGHRDFGVLQYVSSVTGEIRAVPCYRSTGENRGSPGQWFPFHGVNNSDEPMDVHSDNSGHLMSAVPQKGWFIKPQAGMVGKGYDHDHGVRYGHGRLANLAEWMDANIGDYQFNRPETTDDPSVINALLHAENAWGMHPNANSGPPSPPPPPDTVQTGEPMDLAWRLLKMPVFFQEESPWLEQQMYEAGQTRTPPDPATKPPPRDMRSDMGEVKIVGRGDLPTKRPEVFAEPPEATHPDDWPEANWFGGHRYADNRPHLTVHGDKQFQSKDDKVRATFGKPDEHDVVHVPKFAVRGDSRGKGHGRAGWEELVAEIQALYGDHVTVKPMDILRDSRGFWDKVGVSGPPMRPDKTYGRL